MAIGTTAAIIMGGMAAAGAIGGAKIKSNAAGNAAKTQSQAAQQVAADATRTAEGAATDITNVSGTEADKVDAATQAAIDAIKSGAIDANALLKGVYDEAGAKLDPYMKAGQDATLKLSSLINGPGSEFKFTEDDPSYQWRLQEGMKALERSAASRGTLLGGGAQKAITRYAQGAASQEYQGAFDRFNTSRQTTGQIAQGLAGMGLNATGQYVNAGQNYGNQASGNIMDASRMTGIFGTQGAQTSGGMRIGGANAAGNFRMGGQAIAGNAATGAANATAAGQVAGGNAWGDAFSGGLNNISQMILLSQLGKKPTPTPDGFYDPSNNHGYIPGLG